MSPMFQARFVVTLHDNNVFYYCTTNLSNFIPCSLSSGLNDQKIFNSSENMSFHINLNIKFRAFGITFGRLNRTIVLNYGLDQKTFSVQSSNDVVPAGARVLFDERGVLLTGWL